MDRKAPETGQAFPVSTIIDTAIRVGLVAILAYAGARIVLPFVFLLIWSAILSVMLYPLHRRLAPRLGNRWSALLIGVLGVTLLLGPTALMVTSLATWLYSLISSLQGQDLSFPPAPLWLEGVPVIGAKLAENWTLIAANLPAVLAKYGHLLTGPLAWLGSFAGRLVIGELSFIVSFAIAAVLLAYGLDAAALVRRVLLRVTGSQERTERLANLTAATIRGVGLGVVGVALVQSFLLGLGFFAIGLQAAGPLTLVALLLGIIQIPLILLTLPVVAYVFFTEPTQPAVIFLIWNVVAGLSDNVLRPLLLGRGLEVPMPIILFGVIGGMIAEGLLGLFVGPVLLAVSYVLLLEWLEQRPG
ncbi:AI-2E family transporter [Bosea sp. (in: a-proteobacteria)]|jgi:predicted PurR-regulated permease PerM|uniref:AI-2E family transporter n=1 Tax=Bosea sp. (in: a-proteobacteria) TaxID=1871050 RepID=UPI00086B53FC|nr:AI-2E family transporter [Bosea sp. (in: a-proteobacteria)]MBN9439722.1 AI-2E family transporter [Bosea sp. (in: a-proteobacteria)]ODT45731.1 MAG: AI-2E family transporter [Methylobacterium sp. SCN 67-24]